MILAIVLVGYFVIRSYLLLSKQVYDSFFILDFKFYFQTLLSDKTRLMQHQMIKLLIIQVDEHFSFSWTPRVFWEKKWGKVHFHKDAISDIDSYDNTVVATLHLHILNDLCSVGPKYEDSISWVEVVKLHLRHHKWDILLPTYSRVHSHFHSDRDDSELSRISENVSI